MKTINFLNQNRYESGHVLIGWVFLRGLALIYFAAFASMATQIDDLIGSSGILPAADKLDLIRQHFFELKFWHMPTLFWFDVSDDALKWSCYAGMVASGLILASLFVRTSLAICYVLYLSIVEVGQDFTLFQWDVFLLEIGFLAFLLTWGSPIIVLLFRWLLARFMFMGGVVKLVSGDPTWANLTALNYHYETQPLPTPVAYYAYWLPDWFHQFCVGGVFVIELIVPFFVFLPRRFRIIVCASFLLLQMSIILTGNYNFFNLLVILLCLFLIEDRDVTKWLPQRLSSNILKQHRAAGVVGNVFAAFWGGLVLLVCAGHIWLYHTRMPLIEPVNSLLKVSADFSLINNYGPFAVMTTTRNEIIVQGSNDGLHWSDYEFKYKPGRLDKSLGWNIPHQPRLDWQMWFAALEQPRRGSWFDSFLERLLTGSPSVLGMLAENPFPDHPPKYVRAVLYRYSFTDLQQRELTGNVWERQFERVYWPVRSLD